jgi:hypothetical protein
MKNWSAVLLCLLVVCGPCRTVFAEINIVDSLEWMAIDAPFVVRGKVTGLKDTKGPGSVVYRDVTIAVEETVKGQRQDETINIRLRLLGVDKAGIEWQHSGHSYLFFLCRGRARDDQALTGWWVLRESRQSVIDLNQPQRVYTADLKWAKDGAAILGAVREQAAHHGLPGYVGAPNIFKAQIGYLRLEIPLDTEFFNEVYARSSCYINVPADEKYRPLALSKARSEKYYERAEGAAMLRNFPRPETSKLLRAMLVDPGEAQWMSGSDQLVNVSYPVRLAAYEALVALGEYPETLPLFERKPTTAEIQKVRETYWKHSMREVVPKDWIVASIQSAKEPAGWTRSSGGEGIAVECRSSGITIQDPRSRPYQPFLTLYVMPIDWEGTSGKETGEKLRGGKYIPPDPDLLDRQIDTAQYLGHQDPRTHGARRFFSSTVGHAGWDNPADRLIQYFGLSVDP